MLTFGKILVFLNIECKRLKRKNNHYFPNQVELWSELGILMHHKPTLLICDQNIMHKHGQTRVDFYFTMPCCKIHILSSRYSNDVFLDNLERGNNALQLSC